MYVIMCLVKCLIKVWILTGDKKETATNISRSCGHWRPNMQLIDIAGWEDPSTVEEQLEQHCEKIINHSWKKPLCLIVDGTSLTSIFQVCQ